MDHVDIPPAPAIVRAASLDSIRPWREAIEENRRLPHWKARQERWRSYQDAMRKGIFPLVPAFLAMPLAPLSVSLSHAIQVNNANQSSYSFTCNYGTDDPLRWTAACGFCGGGGNIGSMSINGGALDFFLRHETIGQAVLALKFNPQGASGTVSAAIVDGGGAPVDSQRCAVGVYRITGLLRATPLDQIATNMSTPLSASLRVARGGVLVMAVRGNSTGTLTLTGGSGFAAGGTASLESVQRAGVGSATIGADDAAYAVGATQSGATLDAAIASWAP